MEKPKEKRKYLRLRAYHLVKYRIISAENQEEKVLACFKDISGGGACLLSERSLPVSALIQIYIQFPGISQPVIAVARICWAKYLKRCKKYESGLEFMEINDILRDDMIKKIDSVHKKCAQERA